MKAHLDNLFNSDVKVLNIKSPYGTSKTQLMIKVIEQYLDKEKGSDDQKFMNSLYNLVSSDLDYKKTFKFYLDSLNSTKDKILSLDDISSLDDSTNFLNDQSKDCNRCIELFTDNVITDLIQLLNVNGNNLPNKYKEYIIEMIKNYLEHSRIGLNEEWLKKLFLYVIDNENSITGMIDGAFMCILMTAEKNKDLPKEIIRNLIQILNKHSSLIIYILSRFNFYCENEKDLELISDYLESEYVWFNDGGVKIGKFSEAEAIIGGVPISDLSSEIILKSLIEKKTSVTSKTIDNLLSIISNSQFKQTKITAAKCIELFTDFEKFDNDTLISILSNTNSEIYDVSVYMQSAYAKLLKKHCASSKNSIDSIHYESFINLFNLHDSLQLNNNDYANEINLNILECA
jgi:hypothetical protein